MFEAPQAIAPANAPVLQLGAHEDPLDLTRISMVTLADAFVARLEAAIATRRLPLAVLGDWLLLPPGTPVNREAEQEAAALRRRLIDRGHIRRLAEWLERRPQLGREVFEVVPGFRLSRILCISGGE